MKGRDSIMETLETLGKRAKAASRLLAGAGTKRKNAALLAVARALEEQSPAILAANAADVAAARRSSESSHSGLTSKFERNSPSLAFTSSSVNCSRKRFNSHISNISKCVPKTADWRVMSV